MSGTTAPSVGLLGDHDTVADAIESAGGRPTVLDAADVADADLAFLITVREGELLAAVRAGVDVPTLPFEAGRAVRSAPGMAVEPAIANLLEGRYDPVPYPVLSVESSLGTARALQDVMLVTAEPARISEYVVRSGDEQVGRFRADGVVVATPAGSQGYAGSAGGPVTHPDADVLTVVPIAPFATDQDDWVLPMDGLELAVARDETPVELLADDRTVGTVVEGDAVTLARDGSLTVAVVTESYGVFG